jgi:biofilm PGA synthesis N-glycosyltransferase PgaC
MILILASILFLTGYGVLILYYWLSWKKIKPFTAGNEVPQTHISVIIPARNEGANIPALLQGILAQTYPRHLLEVIVVDDHSTDNTAAIVQNHFPQVTLLSLQDDAINSYKKKAIETGIAHAKGQLIVCTDADCIVQPQWLQTIAQAYQQTGAAFMVAPVVFTTNGSLIQLFQQMDFMVLQGITGASVTQGVHAMCNGANLAYERKVFYEVNGFAGIDAIASGDDMLLMHKVAQKHPQRIRYIQADEVIVSTAAMPDWNSFINQRIRWASKAKYYEDKKIFGVLLWVYITNCLFLLWPLLALITGSSFYLTGGLLIWVAKTLLELPFYAAVARFFRQQQTLKYFFFFQPLHVLYTVIAGFMGAFGKYEWKGRQVK